MFVNGMVPNWLSLRVVKGAHTAYRPETVKMVVGLLLCTLSPNPW